MIKRKLKTRILKRIGLALLIISIISSAVAYLYFNRIVRDQVMKDEEIKLKQMVYQLEFMMTDVINFSKSVAIDPTIQEVITTPSFDSEFQRVKSQYEVANRLVFYKTLRNYIGSMVLDSTNGIRYGSIPYADDRYYQEKFNIPELMDYRGSNHGTISQPFDAYEIEVGQKVFAYKTMIRRLTDSDEIIGDLYMDIHLEYFLKEIRAYAANYENVVLLSSKHSIIYSKNPSDELFQYVRVELSDQPVVQRTQSGYLLVEPIGNMDWYIGTVVSDAYIWERSNFVPRFFLVFFIISIVALIMITSRILDRMIRPITELTQVMENMDYETMRVDLNIHTEDEIELLQERFKEMLSQIKAYTEKIMENELKQKEMSFDILLSQINPHYLYNVLNTVVYLSIAGHNNEVVEVVNAMIHTLQDTLKVGEDHVFTTIKQELDLVNNYCKIQEYRYPNRFELSMLCDEGLENTLIPKTSIQPLVENALLHGIIPYEDYGSIKIRVTSMEDLLLIEVSDNGGGIDEKIAKDLISGLELRGHIEEDGRQHIGLRNIHDRIRHLYGEGYGLEIDTDVEHGTLIRLILPNE